MSLLCNRVQLVPFEKHDRTLLYKWYIDKDMMQYYSSPITSEQTEDQKWNLIDARIQLWADRRSKNLPTWYKIVKDDQPIGACGAGLNTSTNIVDVAYFLEKDYWGKKYAYQQI
jgi:RimJ/RimL family protein N-acetyltransferase